MTGLNKACHLHIAHLARVAIVIFSNSILLRTPGLANEIINLAFDITLEVLTLATTLAIGLGSGRA
jgi:hypothetical protein